MSAPELDAIIAHHEAGHIFASRRFGLPLKSVSMHPTNDTNFAEVSTYNATWLARKAQGSVLLAALVIDCKTFLAGPLAELRFNPDEARKEQLWCGQGWGHDMKEVRELIPRAVLLESGQCSSLSETDGVRVEVARCEQLLDRLCSEMEALVAEHWPAIQRIASHLQRHRTITQDEADAIL